ncbi:type I secretion C-terminal target domain-containing protein [Nostocaceae cyanobacterium CENA369]|uniref:Type I secretion C-terminal target domain-containing protein n=1 Tax=Dendronalium phyllosphericum CENA369 TaxID=1725256 RepID=A0A8J7HX61_9NOST|nr:ELWxxDGT repeat protein [Dendronalium phyllosphericum]MBH8571799.1 type I secretion C-terminal target domain-containing protein [Dendronalium phyllosphericum CENA369]
MANTKKSPLLSNSTTSKDYSIELAKPYLVSDIVPGSDGSYPFSLTSVNDTLYFFTSFSLDDPDEVGIRLWKSNGTEAGTVALKDISSFSYRYYEPYDLTNVNDVLYFLTYFSRLWKSDGTSEGTVAIDLPGGYGYPPHLLANINGILYFSASNDDSHDDLWKSDGTKEGTFRLRELYPGDGFIYISSATKMNSTLYFAVGSDNAPPILWKSDGTTAGTVPFKEFTSGNAFYELTTVKNIFYFTRYGELWKSDGTSEGTVEVKDIAASYLRNFNDTLYFLSDPNPNDGIDGDELWKTDGTATGTVLVKDINPGPSGSFAYRSNNFITEVNSTLYFYADDGTHGLELWKSDGTEAGTVLVKDINPGSDSSIVINGNSVQDPLLTGVNGTLYFYADDGTHGGELWKSDGTAEGTVLVEDIKPGAGSSNISDLANVDGTLYFNADDGIHGNELWAIKTDNTINGNGSRDPLTGTAGSDRIVGGTGKKTITGGAGNDEFVYTSIKEVGQRITDFTVGEDKIVLTQLLDSLVSGGYNGSDAIADGYVRLVKGSSANSTILQIDRDGATGNAVFRNFIELDNVTPQAMNNLNNFVF